MQRRRVVLTGIGLITPYGLGIEPFWEGLMGGRSAVRTIDAFDTAGCPTTVAGQLPSIDFDARLDPKQSALWSRASKVAVLGARLAAEDARVERFEPSRTGVLLGTGYGCTYEFEETLEMWRAEGWRRMKPVTVPRMMPNAPASHVAIFAGARGINGTLSTACSSGALAAGLAAEFIRSGRVDACLTGGIDAILNHSTLSAWCALRVLTRRNDPTACRPFSVDRDGLVLGEGCAVLVLEERESALRRGARIHAEILGVGATNDATNAVAPDFLGELECVRAALADAGVSPDEIDYVNAHGTGTQANDANETKVLKEILGARAPEVPVSSIKGHLGHTMGAAGAIEIAATALALSRGRIPPTLHYTPGDPECTLDYVPEGPRNADLRIALTNSFGFGGQNSATVLCIANGRPL
ncbi:MAG: beta-ketoacyl-[acyl-carrier-protein] synthase family protein [Planctomycetaceae bacterium]